MKLEINIKFLILVVAMMLFIFPVSAEGSSISSQTVSVTIPETAAVSANYGNSSNSGLIPPGTTEVTINNVYLANPSNVDTEIWIRASGDLVGANTANTIGLSNLKYIIQGLGSAVELTDQYTKAGVLKKPNHGSISPMGVDLRIKIPYGTTPDTYKTTIYFTSLKFNSDAQSRSNIR